MAKVSVITPVYKVEKYIERCAESLFNQSLSDMEFIFVDDCGGDKSFAILNATLERFPNRKNQVKILRNPQNMGVGQSRQRGIDASTGDYIIHCDPDDWIDTDMYETLYCKAIETNAEIVVCGFLNEYANRSVAEPQKVEGGKAKLFHDFVEGNLHCSLCNKLVKREVAHRYRIKEGINLWEDKAIVVPMMCNSNNIANIDKCMYHYRIASDISIVHHQTKANIYSKIEAVRLMQEYLQQSDAAYLVDSSNMRLQELKAKHGLLTLYPPEVSLWRKTFPKSVTCANNKKLPRNFRLYVALAKYHLDFIVVILTKMISRKLQKSTK